jgi:ribosome-binding protein aMBF1 (putative translation factor)
MTPAEFKEARHSLGLSVSQMAHMLGIQPLHIRRMETEPIHPTTHRPVRPTVERLMRAYLAGYRPDDWPE